MFSMLRIASSTKILLKSILYWPTMIWFRKFILVDDPCKPFSRTIFIILLLSGDIEFTNWPLNVNCARNGSHRYTCIRKTIIDDWTPITIVLPKAFDEFSWKRVRKTNLLNWINCVLEKLLSSNFFDVNHLLEFIIETLRVNMDSAK